MDPARHPVRLLAIACALACTIAGTALGTPNDVIADWSVEGSIEGDYSIGDLRRSIGVMQQLNPAALPAFAAAVNDEIEQKLVGIDPPGEPIAPATPSVPDVAMPAWAIAGACAAGILVVAGGASAIALRMRRRRVDGDAADPEIP